MGSLNGSQKPTINLIGLSKERREGICDVLSPHGYAIREFRSDAEFLSGSAARRPGCAVVSLVPDGLSLPRQLQSDWLSMPVIAVATSPATVEVVQAMKAGAINVLSAPISVGIVAAVEDALEVDARRREWLDEYMATAEKVQRLSPRQLEVLEQIAIGKPNKVVAKDLFLSPRTVEKHRREVFHRIGATNVAEAAAMWERYKLSPCVAFAMPPQFDLTDRRAG